MAEKTAAAMKPAAEVEAQAADWLARRDGGGWSAADQAALDRWLAEDTAHRIALLRLETVWTKADRLRAVGGVPDADPEPAGAEPIRLPMSRRRARWYIPLAAAAALAAVAVPGWQMLTGPSTEAYATPVGGFQRLPLPDGSRIELNTATRVEIAFGEGERHIALDQGEAYFAVAHDPRRPFTVTAGDYRVTAIGTAFSVRRDGENVSVAVTEGRVRVERLRLGRAPEALTIVAAGQRILGMASTAVVRPAAPQELEQALSWRDGLLIFDNRPLRDAAAEFNRYNGRQLIVDPSAADVEVSGTFRANNLDGFLRLLEQGFGVSHATRDQGEVLLRRS